MRVMYIKSLTIFILIGLVTLTSCYQIRPVQIEVLKPAAIELPVSISRAMVLNAAIPKHKVPIKNEIQKNIYQLDSSIASGLSVAVYSALNESPRFTEIVHYGKLYHKPQNQLLKPIEWTVLEQLSYQNGFDDILALEAINIKDTLISYSTFTESGYVYDHSLMLISSSLWRLYNSKDKQMINQFVEQDTIFLNEFSSIRYFRSRLARKDVREWVAGIIVDETAYKISNKIAPYWATVKRDLFLSFNSEMQIAAMLAAENEWKKAASIWKKYIDAENVKLAAKACHNMALVCEVEGRLDIALVWINKAITLYPNYFSENYRGVIQYRLGEEDILDEQFGNNE